MNVFRLLGAGLVLAVGLASEPAARGQEKKADEKKPEALAREVLRP